MSNDMNNNNNMEVDLDTTLSCPICFEHYGTPKALPCLHTFCVKCLQNLAKGGYRRITCPLCNTEHALPANGIEGFSTNYALDDVMRDLRSPKFKDVIIRNNKIEEVDEIVKREVKNLKHLVDVVHSPLLKSIASLKKGTLQQQKEKIKLVNELYDRIIAHAEQQRGKHILGIQRSNDIAMKYFDDIQSSILKEMSKLETFYSQAGRKSYADMETMDLKAFLLDATEYNRAGRRMATEHSHLMWSEVDIAEDKEHVRQVQTHLGDVIRVHGNKRSHRPRIGTMENNKHNRPALSRQGRSKSEPNADAIEAACLPKVDSKKLSDPVRNVVDTVLYMIRNNGNNREHVEKKHKVNATPKRPPFSPTTSAKRSLFSEPPPYPSRPMPRTKSGEEPMVSQNFQATESAPVPKRSNSTKSTNSGSSGTSSSQGPPKPPRSTSTSAFQSPCGITITPDDKLLIAERSAGVIQITHPRSLKPQRGIKPFRGHMDEAKAHALFDLTVLPNGDVAVTDSSIKKIIFLQRFNNYAAPQEIWMPHDMVPRGITSDAACMYVCDAGNACIQIYTHKGKHVSSVELDNLTADHAQAISEACPQSIAVSPAGHIMVTDIINRCLYLVLRTGEISRLPMKFTPRNGIRCSTPPSQAVPRGLCWLDDRRVVIAEDTNQEILLVNVMAMELINVIKKREFISLQGMVVDSAGSVLVTDIGANRVHYISRADLLLRGGPRPPLKRAKSLPREDPSDTDPLGTLV